MPLCLIVLTFALLLSLPRSYPTQLEYAKTLLQNHKDTSDTNLQTRILNECKTVFYMMPNDERSHSLRRELSTVLINWKRYDEAIQYLLEFANSTLNAKLSEEAYIDAISVCEPREKLIQLCEDFIDKFHYSTKKEEIYFTLIKLKKDSKPAKVIKYCWNFLSKYPKSRHKSDILIILESTYLRDGKKLEALFVKSMPWRNALCLISTLSSLSRIPLAPSFR